MIAWNPEYVRREHGLWTPDDPLELPRSFERHNSDKYMVEMKFTLDYGVIIDQRPAVICSDVGI